MKREFLKQTIPDITDAQLDAIMAENGKDVEAGKKAQETVAALQGEVEGYKKQIADRDKDMRAMQEQAKGNEELGKQLADLQSKYKADTEALQTRLEQQRTDHAVEAAFANVPFASNLARRQAMADFKAKGYKLGEDGKYAESESYIAQLRKDDPDAFKPEQPKDPELVPRFTNPVNPQNPKNSAANPFGFNFQPIRNPNAEKK